MANKTQALVVHSDLTGQYYVVTRYTAKPHPSKEGASIINVQTRYDVTAQIEELFAARGGEDGRVIAALRSDIEGYHAENARLREIIRQHEERGGDE